MSSYLEKFVHGGTVGDVFSDLGVQTNLLLAELDKRRQTSSRPSRVVPGTELELNWISVSGPELRDTGLRGAGQYDTTTVGVRYPRHVGLFSKTVFRAYGQDGSEPVSVAGYRATEHIGDFSVGRHRGTGLVSVRLGSAGLAGMVRGVTTAYHPKALVDELSTLEWEQLEAVTLGVTDGIEAAEMICAGTPSDDVFAMMGKDLKRSIGGR